VVLPRLNPTEKLLGPATVKFPHKRAIGHLK
jgi:hypothetical protein